MCNNYEKMNALKVTHFCSFFNSILNVIKTSLNFIDLGIKKKKNGKTFLLNNSPNDC